MSLRLRADVRINVALRVRTMVKVPDRIRRVVRMTVAVTLGFGARMRARIGCSANGQRETERMLL